MAGIGANIFAGGDVSASPDSSPALATQTYGPSGPAGGTAFSPRTGHGLGFWIAVAGVGVLIFIRQSLPR